MGGGGGGEGEGEGGKRRTRRHISHSTPSDRSLIQIQFGQQSLCLIISPILLAHISPLDLPFGLYVLCKKRQIHVSIALLRGVRKVKVDECLQGKAAGTGSRFVGKFCSTKSLNLINHLEIIQIAVLVSHPRRDLAKRIYRRFIYLDTTLSRELPRSN